MNEPLTAGEPIAIRLHNETKVLHQQLEKSMMPFLKDATNNKHYARLLQIFYGFMYPVAQLIRKQITVDLLVDIDERRQTDLLLEDLKSIASRPFGKMATQLPTIENIPQALGALYVFEGSTLGGQIICGIIMRQLNVTTRTNLRFFNGYGEETGNKWTGFKNVLNDYAVDNSSIQETIISAANETFSCFKDWISEFSQVEKNTY